MARSLPDFDDPPVVETALGVEFAPLEKWSIPCFGLFWQDIRNEYPRCQAHGPLGSQIEQFDAEGSSFAVPKLMLTAQQVPDIRCWFLETSGSRLLQIQRDRFVHNWRKPGSTSNYPHYETIRPTFEREWGRFCDFLRRESLGEPDVVQCEVTYVNHLERGKGWDSFGDVAKVLRCWSGSCGEFLPSPEGMLLSVRYVMPDNRGRLHINLHPALRKEDAKAILQLSLTARGRPDSSSTHDIMKWLDLGREWVVCGFTDFTSVNMHELWHRKEDRR